MNNLDIQKQFEFEDFNMVIFSSFTEELKNIWTVFENNYSFDDLETIRITREMIEEKNDNSFDFLKYLQKRKF